MRAILIFVVAILVIALGYWSYRIFTAARPTTTVACTLDAKLCPDGSYVGRVAPSCDFAPCPGAANAPR